ncbi:metallo-beta-lactamase domain protein [Mycobacterium parascrofulaceum ATCC BAA-614]|uniref:Metallo-beta-lactamase domain protein n=1 Tax=Mycobacterium parascrofulaceum ATCC BAA-614 TaxID=525368 RepID=D5P302_9MYCO|nr:MULTISPECIES: MBL fold metallo-hydrolase [Mycobacterium]EFG79569.1 metallo-beta-lactamase domain protein [Mycobacterium parascrofulaceum ATCC BAA-614]OCB62287.1 Zn-dependent hydrolase [Mycobacterium malmoense]
MTAPDKVSDNYTGHVDPGTAARRTLPGATILKASVGPMDNNAYLVTCSATGETLLIDAANDADVLVGLVRQYAPKVSLIVTSHQHFDHWQALEAVAAATGAPTAANEIDAEALPVRPDRLLAGGDAVQIGELRFEVIHLRGHTPGSIALALDGPATGGVTQLFTGDCLFPGGPGRTTRPEDFDSLMSGLESKVFDRFDDGTVVYPGHGDDTTLGAERPHLAEWRERGW